MQILSWDALEAYIRINRRCFEHAWWASVDNYVIMPAANIMSLAWCTTRVTAPIRGDEKETPYKHHRAASSMCYLNSILQNTMYLNIVSSGETAPSGVPVGILSYAWNIHQKRPRGTGKICPSTTRTSARFQHEALNYNKGSLRSSPKQIETHAVTLRNVSTKTRKPLSDQNYVWASENKVI